MEVMLNSRAESLLGGLFNRSTNHRYGLQLRPMILLCEPPALAVGAKVENGFIVFQGRRPSFAPLSLEARAPNQGIGLVTVATDQGHPRAALDTNDLRICRLGAHHPEESYG